MELYIKLDPEWREKLAASDLRETDATFHKLPAA